MTTLVGVVEMPELPTMRMRNAQSRMDPGQCVLDGISEYAQSKADALLYIRSGGMQCRACIWRCRGWPKGNFCRPGLDRCPPMPAPAMRTASPISWRCLLARSPRSVTGLRPSVLPLNRLPASVRRYAAAPAPAEAVKLAHTRNIGIIAHIDAVRYTVLPLRKPDKLIMA